MAAQVRDDMSLSVTRSPDGSAYYARIGGDVDLRNSRALGIAARELIAADATVIYVDLADVTLVGSSLVGFLVQIAVAKRPASSLILCRPSPSARQVIGSAGLDPLVFLRWDLPSSWPSPETDRGAATGDIIAQRGTSRTRD